MSYRFNFSAPIRLSLSPTPVTIANAPFTLSGWFKLDNFNSGPFIGLSDSTAQYDYVEIGPGAGTSNETTGPIHVRIARGSSTAVSTTDAGPSPARFTWTPFVLTVTNDSRVGSSISGSDLEYVSLPAGTSAWNTLYSGTRVGTGTVTPWNGLVAALAVHSGSWDQTLVNYHATAITPNGIGNCLAYWPLEANLSPTVGASPLVSTGSNPEPSDNPVLTQAVITLRPTIISLF